MFQISTYFDGTYEIPQQDLCSKKKKKVRVVTLITSKPSHKGYRNAIRKTWGKNFILKQNHALAFLIGQSKDKKLHKQVLKESHIHNDVIVTNFIDDYKNLTLKSVSKLHWILHYCPTIDFFLKIDDDMYLNFKLFEKFLKDHSRATESIYGRYAKGWPPNRDKKTHYYLPLTKYSHGYLPDFLTGGSYIMTADLIPLFYYGSYRAKFFFLEDVFMGFVADKYYIHLKHEKGLVNLPVKANSLMCDKISFLLMGKDLQFDAERRLKRNCRLFNFF